MKTNHDKDPEESLGPTPYVTVTQGLKVMVWPVYDEYRSQPSAAVFFYRYHIKIKNESPETMQLLRRRWEIRDGFDELHEVEGEGVIGQKPVLQPGDSFVYSSFCPLRTPSGTMQGSFQMMRSGMALFDAKIGVFDLKNQMMVN